MSWVVAMSWVVRLEFTKDGITKDGITQCAGTVVHKSWILTTQDCCQVSFFTNSRLQDHIHHKSGNTVRIFYKDYTVGSADVGEFSGPGEFSEPDMLGSDGTCFIKGSDSNFEIQKLNLYLRLLNYKSKLMIVPHLEIPLWAHTDLSTNYPDGTISSIETKIPCLMDSDTSVNDLQGYRCWSVGWGKTTQVSTISYNSAKYDMGRMFSCHIWLPCNFWIFSLLVDCSLMIFSA